jgi:hypothetical protein
MHTKPIRDALDKNKKAIVEDIKRAASGQEQEFRDGLSAAGCDITKLPRDSLDSFVQALLHRLIETEDDSTLLKVIQYLKDFCRRSDHIKQLARLVETVDTDNRKVPKQYSPPPEVPIPPLPKERHDYALKTTPINSIRTILSSRIGTKIGPTDCREAGRICGLPHASISFATAVANADISLLFGVIEHLGHIREAAKAVNAGHEGLIIPPEEICNIEKLENRLDHFFESLSISLDLAKGKAKSTAEEIAAGVLSKGGYPNHHILLGKILYFSMFIKHFKAFQKNSGGEWRYYAPFGEQVCTISANVSDIEMSILQYIRENAEKSYNGILPEIKELRIS